MLIIYNTLNKTFVNLGNHNLGDSLAARNIILNENEIAYAIPDEDILANKINYAKEYTLIFDENEDLIDITVIKTFEEDILNEIRKQRNALLNKTDIYLIPDYPISEENLNLIKIYRQSLRDFPSVVDLNNIEWPINPLGG